MLTDAVLEEILVRLPRLTIGVLGDLFLDRYLDIDGTLTEPSLETGLDAYQVVRVRNSPGAAGTVINNLTALGVGRIRAVSVLGDDGEGDDLRRALARLEVVDTQAVFLSDSPSFHTPTYTKPMLAQPGRPAQELNRLDIKNRSPLPPAAEDRVLHALGAVWPQIDALLVLDQVSEANCGVITDRVRQRLAELGSAEPKRLLLADSRARIGLFRSVWLKPNLRECREALGKSNGETTQLVWELASQAGRPVFCTRAEDGILVADPRPNAAVALQEVPAFPVRGPLDPVGAGDSTSAGIACALAAGANLAAAAAFGNLVASITIQQLGTTGTATPAQVRERWRQVRRP